MIEQSEQVGGCCSTFEKQGYKIDIGASIIEFPQVIDLCFKRMGTSFYDEVDLIPVDPTFSAILHDGSKITYPISLEETRKQIEKISPKDAKGWEEYSKKIQGFLDAALEGFFVSPAGNLTDVIKLFAKTPALLKYNRLFFSSYEGIMRKYFKNEKILESFSFHNYLADTYLPGLKDHVVLSELSTPVDFEKRLRSPEGAIYALRQDLPHSMMFRPSAKSRHIKGLYLVGASTHPGGGVPTVIASGMIVADLIEKYEK